MRRILLLLGLIALLSGLPALARAQSFGVELNNTLMPASGGMGGVSIARPQDLTSALNANPAALTQFQGTQFTFGGGWAEPTYNLTQSNPIPLLGVGTFSSKSDAPGVPMGNIGVTQDLSELGLPATFGIGFVTTAGGFVDFRDVPASNGTNTGSTVFNLPVSLGMDVTERLSLGATLALGIAFFDAPFVSVSGMTPDYALRGTVGANYLLSDATTVGAYYQTEQSFRFENAFLLNPGPGQTDLNVQMDLPQNAGFGIANTSLMDGCLLLGVDVLYKMWDQADLYKSIYNDQWVVQLGAQYSLGQYRLRGGYVWAENPIDDTPDVNVGGVPLGNLPSVRYTQGLMAITSQHRISAGLGVVDVLPGVNLDMSAGGMFRSREQLGPATNTSIASYWVSMGLTWRFGRGSCCPSSAPNQWCETE